VAAVAAQSSPQQQQQQQQQPQVTVEELREKGDLQRSYYSLLLGLTMNNLTGSLLQLPAQVLDNIMTALAKGAATHVDPAVRRSCIQVGTGAGDSGSTGYGWCFDASAPFWANQRHGSLVESAAHILY
jgi:hypothetical protein